MKGISNFSDLRFPGSALAHFTNGDLNRKLEISTPRIGSLSKLTRRRSHSDFHSIKE